MQAVENRVQVSPERKLPLGIPATTVISTGHRSLVPVLEVIATLYTGGNNRWGIVGEFAPWDCGVRKGTLRIPGIVERKVDLVFGPAEGLNLVEAQGTKLSLVPTNVHALQARNPIYNVPFGTELQGTKREHVLRMLVMCYIFYGFREIEIDNHLYAWAPWGKTPRYVSADEAKRKRIAAIKRHFEDKRKDEGYNEYGPLWLRRW